MIGTGPRRIRYILNLFNKYQNNSIEFLLSGKDYLDMGEVDKFVYAETKETTKYVWAYLDRSKNNTWVPVRQIDFIIRKYVLQLISIFYVFFHVYQLIKDIHPCIMHLRSIEFRFLQIPRISCINLVCVLIQNIIYLYFSTLVV